MFSELESFRARNPGPFTNAASLEVEVQEGLGVRPFAFLGKDSDGLNYPTCFDRLIIPNHS